jgi:hypothetical protein
MNAIFFQLKKPPESNIAATEYWRKAADAILKSIPNNSTNIQAGEGYLLITGENAFHLLSPALAAAVNCAVPYRVAFIEKWSEWEYSPKHTDKIQF